MDLGDLECVDSPISSSSAECSLQTAVAPARRRRPLKFGRASPTGLIPILDSPAQWADTPPADDIDFGHVDLSRPYNFDAADSFSHFDASRVLFPDSLPCAGNASAAASSLVDQGSRREVGSTSASGFGCDTAGSSGDFAHRATIVVGVDRSHRRAAESVFLRNDRVANPPLCIDLGSGSETDEARPLRPIGNESRAQASVKAKCKPRAKGKARGRPCASKTTLLARERQRRYRAKAKNKVKPAVASTKQQELLASIMQYRRPQRRFRRDNVAFIIRVGTCPSAGGARSPLAGVISHVQCRVSRWTVDRYRWRAYVYMMERELEEWRKFAVGRAVGFCLKWDETPMKLFVDGAGVASSSILVRNARAFAESGEARALSPMLCRPSGADSNGLLGALGLQIFGLDRRAAPSGRWQVLLIITDGAAVNAKVVRSIVWGLRSSPRTIVLFGGCVYHVLNNATQWSLGKFAYGSLLRLCHVMAAKRLPDLVAYCRLALSLKCYSPDPPLETQAREFWPEFMRYVMSNKGPFAAGPSSGKLRSICEEASALFPTGLPLASQPWACPEDVAPSRYAAFLSKLFRRTMPTPVRSRWYTVENFAWVAYGMKVFGLVDYIVLGATEMRYWPGDECHDANGGDAARSAKNSARLQKLQAYVQSREFDMDLIVACVTSIPRWRFVQAAEAEGVNAVGGVTRALAGLAADTWRILGGRNCFVEILLDREVEEEPARLCVFRSLLCALLYTGEKNRPYNTACWRAVRGDVDVDAVFDLDAESCCVEDGAERKIRDAMGSLSGAALEVSVAGLRAALNGCRRVYLGKGGSDNTECERSFSVSRSLGAKHPHRPPKLSTLRRETVNSFYLAQQKRWADDAAEKVFGSAQDMRAVARSRRPTVYNAFTAFLHAMGGFATDCDVIWQRLSADSKIAWGKIAMQMNGDAAEAPAASQVTDVSQIGVGPLGSTHPTCPIDVEEAHSRLNEEHATLPDRWTVSYLKLLADRLDTNAARAPTTQRDMDSAAGVRLPGDPCAGCALRRARAMQHLSPMSSSIVDFFESRSASGGGLTVGVVCAEDTRWFFISCVIKRPLRILAVSLEVLESVHLRRDGLGFMDSPSLARPNICDVMDGRSMCIMDQYIADDHKLPIGLVYPHQTGAASGVEGWCIRYDVDCEVNLLSRATAHKLYTKKRGRGCNFGRVSAYEEAFGPPGGAGEGGEMEFADDIPDGLRSAADADRSDSEGEAAFFGGYTQSEDELSSKLAIGEDDRANMTQQFRGRIDTSKYDIFASAARGIITVFWKNREKQDHRQAYIRARSILGRYDGARRLTASRSSLLSLYELETCLYRCTIWQQWHAAWVYDRSPSIILPPEMPLPPHMAVGSGDSRPPIVGAPDAGSAGDRSESLASRDEEFAESVETSDVESTSEGTLV